MPQKISQHEKLVALKTLNTKGFKAASELLHQAGTKPPSSLKEVFPASCLMQGLHEISSINSATSLGFALTLARLRQTYQEQHDHIILLTQTKTARKNGRLYAPGLSTFGLKAHQLTLIEVTKPKDLLWAAEEAASTSGLSAVLLQSVGEKQYDFTASRRLKLRAHASNTPVYVLGTPGRTTAYDTRWMVSQMAVHQKRETLLLHSSDSLRWRVSLQKSIHFRGRFFKPQDWQLEWQHETHSFHLVPLLSDRNDDATDQPSNQAYG